MKKTPLAPVLLALLLALSACTIPAQNGQIQIIQTSTPPAAPPTVSATLPTAEPTLGPLPLPTAVNLKPTTPTGTLVNVDGFEFLLPPTLGSNVEKALLPETPFDLSAPDWINSQLKPAYLRMQLLDYPLRIADENLSAQVQVFRTDANITAMNGDRDKVNAIVASPGMTLTRELMPANYLMFASNFSALNSSDGSVRGVRMLAIHGNGITAVTNDGSLTYQFHGVSSDGKYYLIVQLPINAAFLPASFDAPAPEGGLSVPTESEGFLAYMQQAADMLQAAEAAGSLTPSIAEMDALVKSLKLNNAHLSLPAPLPTQVPSTSQPEVTGCQDQAAFKGEELPLDNAEFAPGAEPVAGHRSSP